jgi:hypothetical protein
MSRAACRNAFEERFTSRRMAQDYLRVYEQLVNESIVNDSMVRDRLINDRLMNDRLSFNQSLIADLSDPETETLAEDAA